MSIKLLQKYSEKWSLSNPVHITNTATGYLYRVDTKFGPAVLKIFTKLGIKDESSGTYFLKYCNGKGVVKIYDYDEGAQLLELLHGDGISHLTARPTNETSLEVFTKIISKVHTTVLPSTLKKLRTVDHLLEVFDRIEIPNKLKYYFDNAIKLHKSLSKTHIRKVLLHGDLHHENVMKSQMGEYVCFDPKGLIGDPCYEFGTILANPVNRPDITLDPNIFQNRVKYFATKLNLSADRIISFAYVYLCLSIAWSVEDGFDYSETSELLEMVHQEINKVT